MVEAGNMTGMLRDLINSHGKAFGIKSVKAAYYDKLLVVDADNMEYKIMIDGIDFVTNDLAQNKRGD